MRKFTKLDIWDFDGTLIDTPLPEEGKILYKKRTGKDWPHAGWWGQAMSLDPIFDAPVIKSVHADYQKEKTNKDVCMVMLTGRLQKLAGPVEKILKGHGLEFHEYMYNRGGATEVSKMKSMDELLAQYPNITEIEMWEDRTAHIEIFEKFFQKKVKEGRIKSFHINHITSDRH